MLGVSGPQEEPAPSTRFGLYLFTHGAWFLAFGVQTVLFPYLVRVVLEENAIRFGFAQMALQLPTTLFILVGGVVADRVNVKRMLVGACALAIASFLALGTMVETGALTYDLLIGYALVVGTLSAFAMPARDSLLSLVAPGTGPDGIPRAVAGASLAQFGSQILGMALAAAAPIIGVGPLLLGQAGLMALATAAAANIRPRPREPRETDAGAHALAGLAGQIGGGFKVVAGSPVLWPVVACATAQGICFMGSFFVLLPLIVEGYFSHTVGHADRTQIAGALAIFNLCFWVGSMISALAMVRLGAPRRKGLAYMMALSVGALVLVACAIPVPLWALDGLSFVWGLGGGVAMTLGRSLVQEHAPAETRARVLSIFSLGMMGGGPIGALIDGYLAQAMGPHRAILIPGVLMLVLVGAIFAFSRLKDLGNPEPAGRLA